ncbi:cysteine--tRNA ligase [Candidatus Saccharibacteria bacterium]|nr:cysteine--tRNA ligase [Candidatus Saccharibacteria bacterium]
MMRFHNTLSREVEELKPLSGKEIKLYTCGPTVYDYAHIGNLRSFVFDDTLRRALEYGGYEVKHVMNITDVGHLSDDADEGDDKLEKGAKRESKTVWEVSDYYIGQFLSDMAALNILQPNGYRNEQGNYARATDFIDKQIEIVKILIEKGFAYTTEQAIYFDVTKLDDYGKLTGQKLADKEVGARSDVVVDDQKHHPQDFALWFFTVGRFADHSMVWDSPWGKGFPGWHLECSAIIHTTLGETIDIHTGGVDHIGTHHTNEIAQTEAAFGKKLANYWLHNEHLLVDGHKMSKSAGNYYTLKDIVDKGFKPLALRLLFLQSHYRSQSNFNWEAMDAASILLKKLNAWADLSLQSVNSITEADQRIILESIEQALATDLNTPQALAILNESIDKSAPTNELLMELDKVFGLQLADREDISPEQRDLIGQRQAVRDKQDWQAADDLRQTLSDQGIDVSDTPDGQVWARIS